MTIDKTVLIDQNLSVQDLRDTVGGRDQYFRPFSVSKIDDNHKLGFKYPRPNDPKHGVGRWRNWY